MKKLSVSLFFLILMTLVFLVPDAAAEKITGNNKSERIISQTIATPGDKAGHVMIQTVTMSKTTSSNTEWNDVMMVDYQHLDQFEAGGNHMGYGYHKHKNGDTTYFKYSGTQKPAGEGAMSLEGKYEWTGGTGKFKNIKGGGAYTCKGTTTHNSCDWQGDVEY